MPDLGNVIAQAAALPYRREGPDLSVLLVTSLTSRRWILPKGHIEANLTAVQTAEKEAFEEAGITGRIDAASIGNYTYVRQHGKDGTTYRVDVFPMEVLNEIDHWPEALRRERSWMTPDDATASVAEPELKDLIRAFVDSIRR